MQIHISNLNGYIKSCTAQIAQNMVSTVGRQLGYLELGVFGYPIEADTLNEMTARFDGMLSSVKTGDVIILQLPSWNGLKFDHAFISRIKQYGHKLILFVHDVVPLMFESNLDYMPFQIEIFNFADVIILPTEQMKNRLIAEGLTVKKVIIQKMWDYPLAFELSTPIYQKKIYFLGTAEKFTFINDWHYDIPIHVFDDTTFITQSEKYVVPLGWQDDISFANILSKGGFGLVWSTDDYWSEYLKLNLSYKISAYLTAGIPIFFKNGLAIQKILEENGLGIAVNSLEETIDIVKNMTEEMYNKYAQNIARHNVLLKNGFYTRKILTDSVHALFSNQKDF